MSEVASREASDVEPLSSSGADVLWTSLGLVAPLNARISGGVPESDATGVSIDTRTLEPGDLFVAISGANNDGHDYVAAAFAKGAVAAVVDEAHAAALVHLGPLYVVRDVLPALERLGVAARARTKARVVAVTGSVGKTSTKEALRVALTQGGAVHASVASYNNHWGVPLTLARMPKATRFGIFEIGMNHADEITPLTLMVRPHVAIITTVAAVHIENFPNRRGDRRRQGGNLRRAGAGRRRHSAARQPAFRAPARSRQGVAGGACRQFRRGRERRRAACQRAPRGRSFNRRGADLRPPRPLPPWRAGAPSRR